MTSLRRLQDDAPDIDEDQISPVRPAYEDDEDEDAKLLKPSGESAGEGSIVWSGTLAASLKDSPFEVDAFLVDGLAQSDFIPPKLSMKATLSQVRSYFLVQGIAQRGFS